MAYLQVRDRTPLKV